MSTLFSDYAPVKAWQFWDRFFLFKFTPRSAFQK